MENIKESPEFDASAPVQINLKREKVSVTVRYPSDKEWAVRQAKVKTFIVRLHGGASETTTDGMEQADEELLDAIRTDDGPRLADALASVVVSKLNQAEAEIPQETADGYRIGIRVLGGAVTVHCLRVPTEKEKRSYQRGAYRFLDLRHGRQQIVTSLRAVCDFYDLLAQSSEGYASGSPIPAPHKLAAVSELMQQMNAEEEEPDPQNFI